MALTRRALLAGAGLVVAGGWARAGDDGTARARRAFGVAVAEAYGLDLAAVTVQPAHPGLPDNPFDPLAWGSYRAFRADFASPPGEVHGFASVADGPPAFARFSRAGAQGGISAILEAMAVLDPARSAPLEEIVRRIAWCHPGFGRAERHREVPWALERGPDGAMVSYTASRAERTGLVRWRLVVTEIAPGYLSGVRSREIP